MFDMHTHSNKSDAIYSPKELISKADEMKGLEGIALTDHDTTKGIDEALETAKNLDIKFIPGVEMSFLYRFGNLEFKGHLLGYFIDHNHESFNLIARKANESRQQRNYELIQAFKIDTDNLLGFFKKKQEKLTRDDIITYIEFQGTFEDDNGKLITDIQQAYDLVENKESKFYAPREKMPLMDVAETIRFAGGVPILAHPGFILKKTKITEENFEKQVIPMLTGFGIRGFEIYAYDKVGKGVRQKKSEEYNQFFSEMNIKYNFINNISGSDFHSPKKPAQLGSILTDEKIILKLKEESCYSRKGL